jgi:opacity protein-like surface antigen
MRDSTRPLTLIICLSVALLLPRITQAQESKLRIKVEKAKIHLMPDAGSTVLRVSRLGELLDSDKQEGEWFRVILSPDEKGFKITGFVHSSAVEVIAEKPVKEITKKKQKPDKEKPSTLPAKPVEPPTRPPQTKPVPPPPSLVPQSIPGHKIEFSLKLYGGMNYLLASDINNHLQATTDYWNDRGVDVNGEFEPLQMGIDFGGEFIINLTPHIGIALGGSYIQASSKSTVNNVWFGYSYQDTANPKITAVSLTLSTHFNFPLGKRFNFTAHGGLGYYLGTFSWNYGYDSEFDDIEENWEGKANALGFQGGLGLELNFSSGIALVVEGFGRYAKLKGLKGDYFFEQTNQEQESIDDATLWYYEWGSSLTGNYYPTIKFDDEKPEETSSIKNVREGEVNLTGFSVRLGIKIRF